MAEQKTDELFWDCVVNIAADDVRLRRVLSGILMLQVDPVPEDYCDMNEYLFNRYGLSRPDQLEGAFGLCEERLLQEYVIDGR